MRRQSSPILFIPPRIKTGLLACARNSQEMLRLSFGKPRNYEKCGTPLFPKGEFGAEYPPLCPLLPPSLRGVAGDSRELPCNSHSQGKLSLPLTSLTGYFRHCEERSDKQSLF
ncbi:MAG: hypothetical protein ACPLPS_09875 [bacterium]